MQNTIKFLTLTCACPVADEPLHPISTRKLHDGDGNGREEPTQLTQGKTDKDQTPGRTSLTNSRGEAPRQTTRQTARGSWGWSLLQVDTEIQRGGGRAAGSVLRILWRESQKSAGYGLPDGGGPGLTAEELRRARPRAGSPPATLPILQDDGSRDARLFHGDGVRAQLGTAHPLGWGRRTLEGRRSSSGWKGWLPGSSPHRGLPCLFRCMAVLA